MNLPLTFESLLGSAPVRLVESLVENMPVGFAFLDPGMRFRIVNARLAQMDGRSIEEHLGQRPDELFPAEAARWMTDTVTRVLAEGRARLGVRFSLDPATIEAPWVTQWYPVVSDGRTLGVAGLFEVDESAIPDLIGADNQQFDLETGLEVLRLREELDRSIQVRSALTSVVSHDVRGSLAALRLTTTALLRSFRAGRRPADSEIESALQDLDREASSLIGMVEKLLAYSTIAGNNLVLQREVTDLSEIATASAAALRDEISTAGAELRVSTDEPVMGRWDRSRLLLAVANILQNAVRHAPGGPIEIKTERIGEVCRLTIADHGPGIPPGECDAFFEPFVRGPGKRRGFGVGLWIARRVAELHGGSLTVTSPARGGAQFTLELPVEIPAPH